MAAAAGRAGAPARPLVRGRRGCAGVVGLEQANGEPVPAELDQVAVGKQGDALLNQELGAQDDVGGQVREDEHSLLEEDAAGWVSLAGAGRQELEPQRAAITDRGRRTVTEAQRQRLGRGESGRGRKAEAVGGSFADDTARRTASVEDCGQVVCTGTEPRSKGVRR